MRAGIKTQKISRVSIVVLLSLSFLFLFSFYRENLEHPNKHLFTDTGDGLKSFYVYDYHIFNDTSFTNTQAVNYPYGEIHVYTDGQTFFANAFRLLIKIIPAAGKYSITFLNGLMLMSFVFCFLLLFLILKKLFVPDYLAIAGAISIGVLSPQVFRFLGHPSLSYCFIIPLVWYLQILFFEKEKKWRYSILIAVTLLVVPFIHAYYILICGLFVFLNWLVLLLQTGTKKFFSTTWVHILIQFIVPLIFFEVYLKLIDHHSGRSNEPYGILYYTAGFNTVFIPHHPPFDCLFKYFLQPMFQQWEGWAYIGFSMLLVFAFSLFKTARYVWRKKINLVFKPVLPFILRSAIWAAILLLVYSFGYPFKARMMFLLDLLPALKQFRSLGRFAWVFYYVFTVYGVYIFYLTTRKLFQKKLVVTAYSLQVIFFIALLTEGFAYHKETGALVSKAYNEFNKDLLYENYKKVLAAIDSKKFQAILPLPYYHIGSEAQFREAPDSTMRSSMYIAFYSKLPLVASSSARCSMNESRKLIQLLSPSFMRKEAEAEFKDKRPLLITYSKDILDEDELRLLKKAQKIYGNDNIELFELSYDSLFSFTAQQELNQFDNIKDSLFEKQDFMITNRNAFLFLDDFENNKCDTSMNSSGALKGQLKDFTHVLSRRNLPLDEGKEYVASFWYYNKGISSCTGFAAVEETNPDGSAVDWRQTYSIGRSPNIDGDWSLVEMKFNFKKKDDLITIFTKGADDENRTVYRDNLLIREAGCDVYKVIESENGKTKILFKNNFIIRN